MPKRTAPITLAPVPSSPTPNQQVMLAFPEAIRSVIEGKKVTRLGWEDDETYVYRADGYLVIHNSGEASDKAHAIMLTDGDMLSDDWVISPA